MTPVGSPRPSSSTAILATRPGDLSCARLRRSASCLDFSFAIPVSSLVVLRSQRTAYWCWTSMNTPVPARKRNTTIRKPKFKPRLRGEETLAFGAALVLAVDLAAAFGAAFSFFEPALPAFCAGFGERLVFGSCLRGLRSDILPLSAERGTELGAPAPRVLFYLLRGRPHWLAGQDLQDGWLVERVPGRIV